MSTTRAFGLDLSGYSGERSSLAEVQRDAAAGYSARIFRKHPFARRAEGHKPLADFVAAEREAMEHLLRTGRVLVDIPIDLQSLPSPVNPRFIWELTARPVDFAYGGLRPLADRIGAPVARFQNIIGPAIRNAWFPDRLLETYPAASLMVTATPYSPYKGQSTTWDGARWTGGALAEIAHALHLGAMSPILITDDDVDAILCALVGVVPPEAVLAANELVADMRARLSEKLPMADAHTIAHLDAPAGYRILQRLPDDQINVELCDWPP